MPAHFTENVDYLWHDQKARRSQFRFERWNFRLMHGYSLNLENPRSYNEKICVKKILDRNPLIPITADKYAVREYVGKKLGGDEHLIPLLWAGDDPTAIPFETLPKSFIVKANHGSRMNWIVEDIDTLDKAALNQQANKWLRKSFGVRRNEWAYQPIERKIVIEPIIVDASGHIPADIKFHMFNGRIGVIEIIADRHIDRVTGFFDSNLQYVPMKNGGGRISDQISLPDDMDSLSEIAHILAEDFDHVRVDLYHTGEHIYFGELTHYNASGRVPIKPREWDYKLGEMWEIEQTHYRKIW